MVMQIKHIHTHKHSNTKQNELKKGIYMNKKKKKKKIYSITCKIIRALTRTYTFANLKRFFLII